MRHLIEMTGFGVDCDFGLDIHLWYNTEVWRRFGYDGINIGKEKGSIPRQG